MILWIIKVKNTGLIHHVRTSLHTQDYGPRPKRKSSAAATLCGAALTIDWRVHVEMPHCAIVTCLRCVTAFLRRR